MVVIKLIAPTNDGNYIKQSLRKCSSFIYIVSYAGVTGSKEVNISNVKKIAKMIRKQSKIPIGVGFGIKNYEDVKKVSKLADLVICGSSIVEKIKEGYDLVCVSRYKDGAKSFDDNILTSFGNKLFTNLVNFFFNGNFTDVLGGYKCIKKEIFNKMGIKNKVHQTDTLKKDHLTASATLDKPKNSGLIVMAALIRNKKPPPR